MCKNNQKISKNNVNYERAADGLEPVSVPSVAPTAPPANLLDASVDSAWFSSPAPFRSHASAISRLAGKPRLAPGNGGVYGTIKRARSVFQDPVHIAQPNPNAEWPLYSDEPPHFPPPWPSRSVRAAMERESAHIHPEQPLGPIASSWVRDLQSWYAKLQDHFKFDPINLPANLRRSIAKWEKRLAYRNPEQPETYRSVIGNIRFGHRIPFKGLPKRFFRSRNPPSLAADKHRAWAAIVKDMRHGALRPVDLATSGVPRCVCPVRTAEKNDGTARFVHNSTRVNKYVPCK